MFDKTVCLFCFVGLFDVGNWNLGFSGPSSLDEHVFNICMCTCVT